jgi:hypothetical protein
LEVYACAYADQGRFVLDVYLVACDLAGFYISHASLPSAYGICYMRQTMSLLVVCFVGSQIKEQLHCSFNKSDEEESKAQDTI